MERVKMEVVPLVLIFAVIFSVSFSCYANNYENDTFLFESISKEFEEEALNENDIFNTSDYENDIQSEETIKTNGKVFIEETEVGLSINDYEKDLLRRINEMEDESTSVENEELEDGGVESSEKNVLESLVSNIVLEKVDSSGETIVYEETTTDVVESTIDISELNNTYIATLSEIEGNGMSNDFEYDFEHEDNDVVATTSELKDIKEVNLLGTGLFGSGNHTSTASPSVVINSTYDRYEIYTGENEGVVRIFDDNGTYYNNNSVVKVIRDMMDTHNNSPILLKLANNAQFFDFDNSNDNYVLLPDGFVEDLIARESGNGYLNPQGISLLDHIKVDLTFNSTDLGRYDLFEYGVLYYISCYEGVLGEYYYYDPNTTDINRAATFYVNNRIMNRTYSIVSEYYYKSPSGEQLSFKPTWLINNDNLTGANKENYAKQWVNFPYFLIKTGEKYWNLRDSIEQSTYLTEYAEGYYEQYLTEQPYGNVEERLTVLDDIYKSEADLLNDNTSTLAVHPYVKSNAIAITGNFRSDTITDANKLRSGGALPYDTYAVLNLNVTDHRAKSVQVYLNGEKLISNNNHGLYTLSSGKCQLRIDGSKLLDEENSRNVISFILLNEEGNYLTDAQGRVINSYISLIRNSSINKVSHLISFNTNGGSDINSVSVEEGNKLSLPTNPYKKNKNFLGWYNDTNFQSKFNPNDYIIGSKTLHALWGDVVSSGGYHGGGSGGGGGGGGGGKPAGTTTSNMLNPLTGQANANVNVPNTANSVSVHGNWFAINDNWQFSDDNGNDYKERWAYIDLSGDPMNKNSSWYRFDDNGNVVTGFFAFGDKVYYLDDGAKNKNNVGKMLIGWHWLPSPDGGYACYYFDTSGDNLGVLVTDGATNDGYCVDIFGRWCDNGQVQRRNYR